MCLYIRPVELPSPIPDELIAGRFRLLAEPKGIRLFDRLRDGEAAVHQLAAELESSQQNVSKHLGVLLRSGLVSRRKEGTYSVYAIADEGVFDLCEQVCGGMRSRVQGLNAVLHEGLTQ